MTVRLAVAILACAIGAAGCDFVFRLDEVKYDPTGDGGTGPDADLVNGPWRMLAAGDGVTCAITVANDALYCWGVNDRGQLGTGDKTDRLVPTLVAGATWRTVTVGESHACGIQTDGSVWCWGTDDEGELGNADGDESTVPVAVAVAGAFVAVDAGAYVSCALRDDGAVFCWGANDRGQVGDASTDDREVPVAVTGGHTFATISVGNTHTCGVTTAGAAYCWGSDFNGELGGGDISARSSPTLVLGGLTWTQISAGWEYTCGVATTGRGYCWGENNTGTLGTNTVDDTDQPQPVSSTTIDWAEITASFTHTCGRRTDGSMWCWGDAATSPLAELSLIPVLVTGPGTIDTIALGRTHTCRHTPGNAIACTGDGSVGQLGDGTVGPTLAPTLIPHPDTAATWTLVSAGDEQSCAIDSLQDLYCWGDNGGGAVGDGSFARRLTPTKVIGQPLWTDVDAGHNHVCGTNAGALMCWGTDPGGSIGTANGSSETPVTVIAATEQPATLSISRQSCAITMNPISSILKCWGVNSDGQVGNNTQLTVQTPIAVGGIKFTAVATSGDHSCAIDNMNRLVHCWGRADRGQCGKTNPSLRYLVPTAIDSVLTFDTIYAGAYRTCGISTYTGTAYTHCWGENYYDSLGRAATLVPQVIHDSASWVTLSLGHDHTCGLWADRGLRCWGRNNRGQLGDGTQELRSTSTKITDEQWAAVSAGDEHTCAITIGGELFCWGSNRDGQLGTRGGWTSDWIVPSAP